MHEVSNSEYQAMTGKMERLEEENSSLQRKYDELLAAIKEHHTQKADDRCWMDDVKLYAAAGLHYPEEAATVGSCSAMLKNCERFVALRMQSKENGWKSYAELEAEIEKLKAENAKLERQNEALKDTKYY